MMEYEKQRVLIFEESLGNFDQIAAVLAENEVDVTSTDSLPLLAKKLISDSPDILIADLNSFNSLTENDQSLFIDQSVCPFVLISGGGESSDKKIDLLNKGVVDILLWETDTCETVLRIRNLARISNFRSKPQVALSKLSDFTQKLLTMHSDSHVSILVADSKKRITGVSNSFCALIGYSEEELLKKKISDIIYPDDLAESEDKLSQLRLSDVNNTQLELRFIRNDGTLIDCEVFIIGEYDDSGNLIQTVAEIVDITERKIIYDKIRYENLLLENVNDAVISTDSELRILSWNRAAENIYGYLEYEVITRNLFDFLSTEFLSDTLEDFNTIFIAEGRWCGEVSQLSKTDERKYFNVSLDMLRDSFGNMVGVVGIFKEIKDRQKKDQIPSYRNKLAELFLSNDTDTVPFASFLKLMLHEFNSESGYFGYFNSNGDFLVQGEDSGINNDLVKHETSKLIQKEQWNGLWKESLKNGKTFVSNRKIYWSEYFSFKNRLLVVPILLDDRLMGQICLADKNTDYTENDVGELETVAKYIAPLLSYRIDSQVSVKGNNTIDQEMLESGRKYLIVVEETDDLITQVDSDGVLTYVNNSSKDVYGLSPSEMIGKQAFDFIYPEDRDKTDAAFSRWLKNRETHVNFENRQLHSDGTFRYMDWNISLHYDEKDDIKYINSIARDTTKLKEAEQKIKEQNDFLFTVIDSLAHPFYVIDCETYEIVLSNKTAKNKIGVSTVHCYEELHGREVPCSGEECSCPLKNVVETGVPHKTEHTHFLSDGTEITVEVHGHPIFDKDGKVIRMIEYALDISDRKNAEKSLIRQSDINSAVAEISGKLISEAHDIQPIYRMILNHSIQLTGSRDGFISNIDRNSGDNKGYALIDAQNDPDKEFREFVFPRNADGTYKGLWGITLNTRKPFYTNNPDIHENSIGTPDNHFKLERFLSIPILLNNKLVGQIAVSNKSDDYNQQDIEAISLIGEIYALAIQRIEFDQVKNDRVKELNGLYSLSELTELSRDLHVIFSTFIDKILPASMQYPEHVNALLEIDGEKYCNSENQPVVFIESKIIVNSETRGLLKVGYDTELPLINQFENRLINAFAERLGLVIGRLEAVQALKNAYEVLEYKVDERTEDLKRLNESLEMEIAVRSQSEKLLRESEEKYRTLTENTHVGIFRVDTGPDHLIIEVNTTLLNLFKYENKIDLLETSFSDLFEDKNDYNIFRKSISSSSAVREMEIDFRTKDGFCFTGLLSCDMFCNSAGKPLHVDGFLIDITQRKNAEAQLKESEENFKRLFDQVFDCLVLINEEGKFSGLNSRSVDLLGYGLEEFNKLSIYEIHPPKERLKIRSFVDKTLSSGVSYIDETVFTSKDNRNIPVEVGGVKIEYSGSTHILASFRDISDRKRVEATLENERLKLRTLLRNEMLISNVSSRLNAAESFDSVISETLTVISNVLNIDLVSLFYIEEETKKMVRISQSKTSSNKGIKTESEHLFSDLPDMVYKNLSKSEIVLISDPEKLQGGKSEYLKERNVGAAALMPLNIDRNEMGTFVLIQKRPQNWDNDVVSLLSVISDIVASAWKRHRHFLAQIEAEKKHAEALSTAEESLRLASIGTLAAGITHEINQPLNALSMAVNGMLYWKERKISISNEDIYSKLEFISNQAGRIDNIIQQMRMLAKQDDAEDYRPVEMNEVVESALSLLTQRLTSHKITVHTEKSKERCIVRGSLSKLEQVIINLVLSSMSIFDSQENESKRIDIRVTSENSSVIVEMRDNGPGIPGDLLDELFNPFITTREHQKGVGFGLAIAHKIVSEHNGKLNAVNLNGGGCLMTVTLPQKS